VAPDAELELSLFSVAGFNSKNSQTRYASGNYLDVDYAVGSRPIPTLHALELSVVGYWLDQLTGDELNGRQYLDGHRSKVFAVGPQARYQFAKGGVALKWLHETYAQNRPQGAGNETRTRDLKVGKISLQITQAIDLTKYYALWRAAQ
jgi:hypothetical protein